MTISDDILEYAAFMECQELHMVVDKFTGLKGIIAIHNTQRGPALGGCRWMPYPSTHDAAVDAMRLAQGMTYKAAISDLPLGGGKAVLIKPNKLVADKEAYFSAFGRFVDVLGGRYITAVDIGTTTEDMDCIETMTPYVTTTHSSQYTQPDPAPFTALGVKSGIEAAVQMQYQKNSLKGIQVAIQGVGHVGYQLAKLLLEAGALVTLCDTNPNSVEKCQKLLKHISIVRPDQIYDVECDVFAPCALGACLNRDTIDRIQAKVIAGAANNQLDKCQQDMKRIQKKGILYAPDFVINAGGLIYVAGQHMQKTEQETLEKIKGIKATLMNIFEASKSEKFATHQVAYDIAIRRLSEKPENHW